MKRGGEGVGANLGDNKNNGPLLKYIICGITKEKQKYWRIGADRI
jgi:hypothetical protein